MAATAPQNAPQRFDIATRVIQQIRQMGVAAIPRNYELVYEAYAGTNAELTRAVTGLGKTPTQDELDKIGERYLGHLHQSNVVHRAHFEISRDLEAVLALLRREQTSLESYSRVLGETYQRINARNSSSVDLVESAVRILTEATGATLAQGREIADSVGQRSHEIDRVKSELDEYKRIANTDPLTRLANRRAFDDVLATIYDLPDGRATTALMLLDIDHFKRVNDTYGHPVGDRVLSILGNVMRANLRNDVFIARTGGEEFAIVLKDISSDICEKIAERLRASIEATPLRNMKTGTNYGPVTVSIGICMAEQADDSEDLYRRCDLALYTAKAIGRNRSKFYYEGVEGESVSDKLLYQRGIA